MVLALGILDHKTARELTFFQFYLVPVALSSWYAGHGPGFLIACLSTVAWGIVDNWDGNPYSIPVIAYWNAVSRMTVFLLSAFVIDNNRRQLNRQTWLAQIDALTEAYNARHFIQLLNETIKNGRQKGFVLTLVYIDLDNI